MSSFFFNDTATTEIYTLSLHDALPISERALQLAAQNRYDVILCDVNMTGSGQTLSGEQIYVRIQSTDNGDRKSTRLNSSHLVISYAVFCLKKKKASDVQPRGAASHSES